jgi:adhesin transport system membrane fusion protein
MIVCAAPTERRLLWGTALFFVVFVVWAALTELDRTVRGAGRVVAGS